MGSIYLLEEFNSSIWQLQGRIRRADWLHWQTFQASALSVKLCSIQIDIDQFPGALEAHLDALFLAGGNP